MKLFFQYQVVMDQGTPDARMIDGQFLSKQGPVHVEETLTGSIFAVQAKTIYHLERDEQIFMNGFQTWSFCPEYGRFSRIRGLRHVPKPVMNTFHFDRYADYHFADYANRPGITHGYSWCYFRKGDRYRLIGSLDERPGYTIFRYDAISGELSIERDCRNLQSEGAYPVFDLCFAEGTEQEVFDTWFSEMKTQPRTPEKLFGYSSWYHHYENISEQTILQDLAGCGRILKKGDLFQIDDGWETKVGDWLIPDTEKFPQDMRCYSDRIHETGYRTGLWLAPFAAQKDSLIAKEHPDWLLKVDGELWENGSNWGGFYSLNIDRDEVVSYIKQVFEKVFHEWNFDLVKLDFLYAAAPFGNEKETRAGRMYRALSLLRECAGDRLILGCGVPVMPAFGLVDYCRVSCDVSLDWDDKTYMHLFHRERVSTRHAIGNDIYRRQLNGRAYLSDPDVFFLREDNIRLTDRQKKDLAFVCAITGGVFLTSDDPGTYSPEQIHLYKKMRYLAENAKLTHVEVIRGRGFLISYLLKGKDKKYFVHWQ